MEKYKVIRVLNSGSFGATLSSSFAVGCPVTFHTGTAILVTRKSTGAMHVIKDIDISKLSKKERETTLQEVRILEALRHPNIVAFDEAFCQDGSLKIVMQSACLFFCIFV
jgi:serine/threonine protein kinase